MSAAPSTSRLAGMRARFSGPRLLLGVAAPLLAIGFAALLTSVVLVISGDSPIAVLQSMVDYGKTPGTIVAIINRATTYYLSALAVAIGFRMNLFNIGVDGQYRLAALLAAAFAGNVSLPGPILIVLTIVIAMLVGGFWAAIAGVLRVTRGVSEVISTIMLNFIATGLIAYLLNPARLAVRAPGSNNLGTATIPESGRVPGITWLVPGTMSPVFGLIVLAVLAGIGYSVFLNRTRFGFDLRSTGISQSAAVASGVNVKRMTVAAMVISGALAGLVGMPQLLGASYTYALDFPAGLGFIGIAIALLGRNHPIGIAFGALLWAYLDRSSQILDFEGVPPEVVIIMQGTIVLSVVVAYELVRRFGEAQQQKQVGEQLAAEDQGGAPVQEARA